MDHILFLRQLFKRELYKAAHPREFDASQQMRTLTTTEGYSLKPFDDNRCIFVHIPKCAGVSVAYGLFGNLAGGHYRVWDYQHIFHPRHFLDYFKFTFVRNPWDRLYSAYSFLKKGGMNLRDKAWSEKHLGACPNFGAFVTDWLSRPAIRSKTHFAPQMDYLTLSKSYMGVDFIGYYENLDKDFMYVCEQLKIKARLPKLNTNCMQEDYRWHYTDKTREIVKRFYRDDIQYLGYTFDQPPARRQGPRGLPLSAACTSLNK